MAFRLHNLGVISLRERNHIRSQTFRLPNDLPSFHTPALLLKRAMDAYEKGDLGAAPVATLLRTDVETILQHLAPLPPLSESDQSHEKPPVL